MKKLIQQLYYYVPFIVSIILSGCSTNRNGSHYLDIIQSIVSLEQFDAIIENSGNRLLAFDLFSDWSIPCHVLEPTLREIASEYSEHISFYKIDTDKFPQLVSAFGATGAPFVVFIKNKKAVYAFLGVQPKESYTQIIKLFCDSSIQQHDLRDNNATKEGLYTLFQSCTPRPDLLCTPESMKIAIFPDK